MTMRTSAPEGAPCWIDLQTSDPGVCRAFYPELFGWTAEAPSEEFGGYFMFLKDGVPMAGCMPADAQAPVRNVWSVYLSTADVAKTLDAAVEAGGQVIVPPMPVADLGTMAFLLDAGGAAIGAWQPGTFAGFGAFGDPGTPSWFELHTRDHAGAVDFYRGVFGWHTDAVADTDEFRYTTMKDPSGDGELAGIMDAAGYLPEGAPAFWALYLGCDDVDATIARLEALGGSVREPAQDSPYGRLATAADPNGAVFKLAGPNAGTAGTP